MHSVLLQVHVQAEQTEKAVSAGNAVQIPE